MYTNEQIEIAKKMGELYRLNDRAYAKKDKATVKATDREMIALYKRLKKIASPARVRALLEMYGGAYGNV